MLQQWVHDHYSRRWCVNEVRLEVCYLPIDTRDIKDNIRCSLVVLDTTEVFYNNLNTNTTKIKNWCASPPWTDHLCTIKFCRHTYICSDNQDLQTQLPKSNQNSDGKPFGNIPIEPVAGRVTQNNSRDFTCAELLYYMLFCILQFLNIPAFGFLKQPQSLHISSLLPHLPAPANTEWSFDNGSCTHTHTYKTTHNKSLYHQAMASKNFLPFSTWA